MMVTFVSQCEKKALNRTRRVLDSFANRIGDNTWQTVITNEGLSAVKKLLRKTASKNTAVSCHWIRSRSRSELVWVVGKRDKFNSDGVVPVNRTQKDIINGNWENNWQHAASIQIVAVLAALLHDIGKATLGFQKKLDPGARTDYGDPYRHEWISLRLFQAMINGCSDDESWFKRLANFPGFMQENPGWLNVLGNDDTGENLQDLATLPPLAQLIGWLIVTHHRLPFYKRVNYSDSSSRNQEKKGSRYLGNKIDDFYQDLLPVDGWVRNSRSCEERKDRDEFWLFKAQPMYSKSWQSELTRWTGKALKHAPLMELATQPISDPFIMHLARLCMMVGDHNYSSLDQADKRRVKGDPKFIDKLAANTDSKTGKKKQALDEHLLGVGQFTARFARLLPQFALKLPTLDGKHRPFTKRTDALGFGWQNRAYDLARAVNIASQERGFFGINLASTGCGKTLGNARIMYALANEKTGARFTIALGLRILTLQTGKALRDRMNLDEASLAILVGGSTNRTLFELNQDDTASPLGEDEFELMGSESLAELVEGIVYSQGGGVDGSELGTVIADPKARDLLYAPIVTCTVDHLIHASENTRGGKHIAPILRLLTSDLVLDEPDDFDQADLPALSRLVHFAGLFGSKVLLSSATLTPDLIVGLFNAYQAGRKLWNHHNNIAQNGVVCAWFDENMQSSHCTDAHHFTQLHQDFVTKRAAKLNKQPIRRRANILPIDLPPAPEGQKLHFTALADSLLRAAQALHQQHHECCPETGKTASIGLIRLANIGPLVQLNQAIYANESIASDTHIHLCCYHARQLLLLRNNLETRLDRILQRGKSGAIFKHSEIKEVLASHPAQHHIFIVLATSVAEVGRDHDYDWAIVEPSSMRSIIQLAGRVWRHRPDKIAEQANVRIMDCNIKALAKGNSLGVGEAVFTRPGFEEPNFLLNTHKVSKLVTGDQLSRIDSIARIIKPNQPRPDLYLADLEHAVMADLLNPPTPNFVSDYWQDNSAARSCVHLQRLSPFRLQTRKQDDYVYLPDEDSQYGGYSFKLSDKAWKDPSNSDTVNQHIRYTEYNPHNPAITPWLTADMSEVLELLAEQLNEHDLTKVALRYATVQLEVNQNGWQFHPWLGFWNS